MRALGLTRLLAVAIIAVTALSVIGSASPAGAELARGSIMIHPGLARSISRPDRCFSTHATPIPDRPARNSPSIAVFPRTSLPMAMSASVASLPAITL